MMLPFKMSFAQWKIYFRCRKRKIYAAQTRKYTLHRTENIRCTKQKIYVARKGKYTLHKMENIKCTKRKIYPAQKRIQITENGEWNTFPTFDMLRTIATTRAK